MAKHIADKKSLKDYVIHAEEEPHYSNLHPPIGANNFELKPSLIGMVQHNQFSGLPTDNLNLHISIFVDNFGTVKDNNVDQNVICLRLFPFSLRDRAWA